MKRFEKVNEDPIWKFLIGASALLFMIFLILRTQGRSFDYLDYGLFVVVVLMAIRLLYVIKRKDGSKDCFLNRLASQGYCWASVGYIIALAVICHPLDVPCWVFWVPAAFITATAIAVAAKKGDKKQMH